MKKGKTCKKINYICVEDFNIFLENYEEENLKSVFNRKYFNLIKRIEKRKFNDFKIK